MEKGKHLFLCIRYFNLSFIFLSEFDKYQISVGNGRKQPPVTRLREEPQFWEFKENLDPGKTYQVIVKTVSGKVTSWPMSSDVTLSKPLFLYQ